MSNIVEKLFYSFLVILSEKLFRPTVIEVKGMENLPKDKGFIIAINHVGSIDPFVVVGVLRGFLKRNFFKRGKRFYYIGMRAIKKRIYSFFLNENLGYVCSSKEGINRAVELLKEGNVVGIFPEGRRDDGKKILKGKKGVAFLTLLSGAPVVPVAYLGPQTRSFNQGLKGLLKPKKVYFGAPMHFFHEELFCLQKNPSTLLLATEMIMLEIAKLCGKEYET